MIKKIFKRLIWLFQAGLRDGSRLFYTSWINSLVKFHPCISGGNQLSINGSVRIKIHSSAHLELGEKITINTGHIANPVGAVSYSVIAALKGSKIMLKNIRK